MKNKGCAFEIKSKGQSRYYVSDTISGLADLAACIISENVSAATPITAADWHYMADHPEEVVYGSCIIADADDNRVFVNEDIGDGMGCYIFPLGAVLEAAKAGSTDLWTRLLALYPNAKKL